MALAQTNTQMPRRPLRLWPGVIVAVLIALVRFVAPLVEPDLATHGILGAAAGFAMILLWWVFFSRAPWLERLGAIVIMIVAALATKLVVHPSIAGGMMGLMVFVYAIPATVSLAFVAWAVASRHLSDGLRRATMVLAILIGCGVWTLARTGGVSGEGISELHWRWTPTPEDRLLAQAADDSLESPPAKPAETPPAPPLTEPAPTPGDAARETVSPSVATTTPAGTKSDDAKAAAGDPEFPRAEWPGFRGPNRDSLVRGVRIASDWTSSPPVEVWRRPIGPGWSSFAVAGDLFYTQEQRGEDEVVSCYRLSSGAPVWRHRDAVRFWESNGGAGPRATPTLSGGRVYTMGATGIVNALDARSGARLWSRDAATDTGKTIPEWGLASSPLVVDGAVIVAVAGQLIAYDADTGKQRWIGESGGDGYSSPHLATIDGIAQVLLLRGARTISVAPADGTLLWEYSWQPAASIVQPAVLDDGLLINTADAMGGQGMRRIGVGRKGAGWTVDERWTSRGLKPYFNDFVVHKGHAFGFDGSIMASISLTDGSRKWKGGRYGHGQLLLLAEQDLLLVISEEGELALVAAIPDQFKELARFKAIEGKTWNHPVLVGDILLTRNGEEMAAFRVSLAGR